MSIEIKSGDLFSTDAKYICHQVNCMGKMGAGIARTIREKYPAAYEEYVRMCKYEWIPAELLGYTQIVPSRDKLIANLFAQERYGFDGKRYTDYDAFRRCLQSLKRAVPVGYQIAFPYGIGCGLGGGEWDVMYGIIEDELSRDYRVEIWKK